jgi:membrane-associated phospholipid phosphatase
MTVRTAWALAGAFACVILAAVTWALAFRTGLGHAADARLLGDLTTLQTTRAAPLAARLGRFADPVPYALLAFTLIGLAFALRGARVGAVVAAVLVIPNVVTQVLKQELAEQRTASVPVDPVSWPSGHSTAAMTLALAAVLIAHRAWRPTVALGGGLFALGMAGSVVLLGWHFPSDTVGGFAVAGAGACLGAAVLSLQVARAAPRSRWRRATG